MTRAALIERLRRQVYGDFPVDESSITDLLVNEWILDGCALAAKKNYTDNLQLESVGFINNSFFSTFKGIAITKDEQSLYKFPLPALALGIGKVDGISRIVFKDGDGNVSFPAILLGESQVGIQRSMRIIPNKILCYPEGDQCFIITTLVMSPYTASVTMVSGGDANDLNSTLNIPGDYIPTIISYIQQQLILERNQPVKSQNDNADFIRTT